MTDLSQLSEAEREALIGRVRDVLVRVLDPEKIILFGSVAEGKPTHGADLDLLVVHDTALPLSERGLKARLALMGVGVPMDLLVYTPSEFDERSRRSGSFTHDVATRGRVLYERRRAA